MLRFFAVITLTLGVFCFGTTNAASHHITYDSDLELLAPPPGNGNLSMQIVNRVLKECTSYWGESYGTLRSAYNHGDLIMEDTNKNGVLYVDVFFRDGTFCVVIEGL